MTSVTLGRRLQKARQETGATQGAQARRFGVTTRTYIRWEQDDCTPGASHLPKILPYLQAFYPDLTLAGLLSQPEPARTGKGR